MGINALLIWVMPETYLRLGTYPHGHSLAVLPLAIDFSEF